MAKETFVIKPLEHTYDMSHQPLNMPPQAANWPTLNVDVKRNSIQKRCGYAAHRTLNGTDQFMGAWTYRVRDGTRHTMMLTDKDLIQVKTGTDETYQYRTQSHTTGTISSISGTTVEGGSSPAWNTPTGHIAQDDMFLVAADYDPQIEDDAAWTAIDSVTDDDTLELVTGGYLGSTTSGAYKIRKVYSVPAGERWSVAVVDNKFCFTNRNVEVQYWSGEDDEDATALNTAYVRKAKFCIEYANRLILADAEIYVAAWVREPWSVIWSKEGDPTDWTDSTAGSADLLDTNDHIMGLGKVGNQIVVYKRKSIIFGQRTGISTTPIIFPTQNLGIGLAASYSIIPVLGSNAFLGDDDFYFIEGDQAVSIGERIRDKFFELVGDAEVRKVFGIPIPKHNKAMWMAVTSEGMTGFVWDYKEKEWTTYQFYSEITGGGEGAI